MTPPTLSGACFWIMVPDTLYQQTVDCHLEMVRRPLARRCHQTDIIPSSTSRGRVRAKTANKKQGEARCLSVFLELTLNRCNGIQSRSAFG